jgi:hypothetical protein
MDQNLAHDHRNRASEIDRDQQEADSYEQQNNEDIEQSSLEEDENNVVSEEPRQLSKIVYPEVPKDFDRNKYMEEFERYEPSNVADMMYARKEKKIPGSVLKPHSLYANLV